MAALRSQPRTRGRLVARRVTPCGVDEMSELAEDNVNIQYYKNRKAGVLLPRPSFLRRDYLTLLSGFPQHIFGKLAKSLHFKPSDSPNLAVWMKYGRSFREILVKEQNTHTFRQKDGGQVHPLSPTPWPSHRGDCSSSEKAQMQA